MKVSLFYQIDLSADLSATLLNYISE